MCSEYFNIFSSLPSFGRGKKTFYFNFFSWEREIFFQWILLLFCQFVLLNLCFCQSYIIHLSTNPSLICHRTGKTTIWFGTNPNMVTLIASGYILGDSGRRICWCTTGNCSQTFRNPWHSSNNHSSGLHEKDRWCACNLQKKGLKQLSSPS